MFTFNLLNIVLSAAATLVALSCHEFAHGWVSYKLGDPTPRMQGRLTLNPLAHLDIIGALLMVFTGFGWAKPVEINPMYYKDKVKGMSLVALAGPLMNFILAFLSFFIGSVILVILNKAGLWNIGISAVIQTFVRMFVVRNLCFMVFNLIPIPPLDGFKVIGIFIKRDLYYKILSYEHYIMYALMFLCLTGAFSRTIGLGVSFVYDIIVRSTARILGIFM